MISSLAMRVREDRFAAAILRIWCPPSAFVKGFGRRPIAAVRQAPRPSSESVQGRNPREAEAGSTPAPYGTCAQSIWLLSFPLIRAAISRGSGFVHCILW
jgi:hypothetical protein